MNGFMFQNYDLIFKKKSNRHFALYKREGLFQGKSTQFFLKFVYLCEFGEILAAERMIIKICAFVGEHKPSDLFMTQMEIQLSDKQNRLDGCYWGMLSLPADVL